MRDEAGAAHTVHIGLLQEHPLQAHEIACRSRGGHAAPNGRLRDSDAGLWRAVDAALLYGPGPAQSAVGGRLAYWPGVDQQRLADGAHQFCRRAGRQYVVARRAGDHQAAAGHGRAGAGGAGRFVPRFTWPVEVGADTKKELVGQAKEWGQIRWDTAANAQAANKHTGELLQLIVATREYQFA